MSGFCPVAMSNTWENEPQALGLLEEETWGTTAGLQCDFTLPVMALSPA